MEIAVLWFVVSMIVGYAAQQRGRNGLAWAVLSLLISPLLGGFLLILFPMRETDTRHGIGLDDRVLRDAIRRSRRNFED